MAIIGEQLKAAREARGVSPSEAGRATKILTKHIVAMESDNFSEMPVPTYAKGFIRLYCEYLEIDPAPLIEEYMQKHNTKRKPLISEDSQLDRNSHDASAFPPKIKVPTGINPFKHFRELGSGFPKSKTGDSSSPFKDVRVIAGMVAGLLTLILLTVSISNCSRRRAADVPEQPETKTAPARMLLDEPAPDLYLVEPGKIETKYK